MHRTEGEDFVIESGKRRYQKAVPPNTPATRLPAESTNSFQEEICNVIELNGVALATNAANDRTANWRQMHDVIFTAKKIGSSALADGAVIGDIIPNQSVDGFKIVGSTIRGSADVNPQIAAGTINTVNIQTGSLNINDMDNASRLQRAQLSPTGTTNTPGAVSGISFAVTIGKEYKIVFGSKFDVVVGEQASIDLQAKDGGVIIENIKFRREGGTGDDFAIGLSLERTLYYTATTTNFTMNVTGVSANAIIFDSYMILEHMPGIVGLT